MALSDDDLQKIREIVVEAMATKIELTMGVDCHDPKSRDEMRTDLKFLRVLRMSTMAGSQRLFIWALGIAGTVLLWAFWPDLKDHWK